MQSYIGTKIIQAEEMTEHNDINAHRESSNKNNLTHGDLFVKHIKSHLKDNQQVICKICGKSVDEIANMGGV